MKFFVSVVSQKIKKFINKLNFYKTTTKLKGLINKDKYISKIKHSNILKEILEGIRKGEFAVFCGAGISFNSGLPLANDLKRYILENLMDNKEDIKKIRSYAVELRT